MHSTAVKRQKTDSGCTFISSINHPLGNLANKTSQKIIVLPSYKEVDFDFWRSQLMVENCYQIARDPVFHFNHQLNFDFGGYKAMIGRQYLSTVYQSQ
jgi:hypothetical protein